MFLLHVKELTDYLLHRWLRNLLVQWRIIFLEFSMSDIVFLNGDFLKAEDAKVSIFDRGYLFGDGIYEVVPVINGKVIDNLGVRA